MNKCTRRDLNRGPSWLKESALPTELSTTDDFIFYCGALFHINVTNSDTEVVTIINFVITYQLISVVETLISLKVLSTWVSSASFPYDEAACLLKSGILILASIHKRCEVCCEQVVQLFSSCLFNLTCWTMTTWSNLKCCLGIFLRQPNMRAQTSSCLIKGWLKCWTHMKQTFNLSTSTHCSRVWMLSSQMKYL